MILRFCGTIFAAAATRPEGKNMRGGYLPFITDELSKNTNWRMLRWQYMVGDQVRLR